MPGSVDTHLIGVHVMRVTPSRCPITSAWGRVLLFGVLLKETMTPQAINACLCTYQDTAKMAEFSTSWDVLYSVVLSRAD